MAPKEGSGEGENPAEFERICRQAHGKASIHAGGDALPVPESTKAEDPLFGRDRQPVCVRETRRCPRGSICVFSGISKATCLKSPKREVMLFLRKMLEKATNN